MAVGATQQADSPAPLEQLVQSDAIPTGAVPAAPYALNSFHGEFANFEEGYIRSYIALADTKAAWAFTIASGLLAFIFGSDETRDALLEPSRSATYLTLPFAVGLLALSAFFSFLVVAPRLKSQSGEGIVFFAAVAAKPDAMVYISEVAAYDESAVTAARLKHCYDVAGVCVRKYNSLRNAIWLGLPGLVLALVHTLAR